MGRVVNPLVAYPDVAPYSNDRGSGRRCTPALPGNHVLLHMPELGFSGAVLP